MRLIQNAYRCRRRFLRSNSNGQLYGTKPYVHGIEPNRNVLETFVAVCAQAGLHSAPPNPRRAVSAYGA